MPKRKFWNFRNASDEVAELTIYGDISDETWWGDEITPKTFSDELNQYKDAKEINVRINSGGGDVFAAQAIGNLLESTKKKVTCYIDGLCASAATIIACHCSKVIAAADSTYMVHPVQIAVIQSATAEDLDNLKKALDTIRDNILSLYERKTGKTRDEVAAWMDATSWWTGKEAMENGFVDEVTGDEGNVVENKNGMLFVNSVSMNMPFNKAPEFVQKSVAAAPAAKPFANTATTNGAIQKEGNMDISEIKTVDELRKNCPGLVKEIEDAAADKATKAERQRIKDIEDMAISGTEQITEEAKFSKPVDAADYAKAILKDAKQRGTQYLANANADAQDSGALLVNSAEPENATTKPSAKDDGPDEFINAAKSLSKKGEK